MRQRSFVDMLIALGHFNLSAESNGIVKGTGEGKQINAPCLLIHGSRDKNV